MTRWRTIDSAPTDGTYVRLKFGEDEMSEADDDGPYIGAMVNGEWWDRSGSDYGYGSALPTHWAPENDTEGEQESDGRSDGESDGL